MSWHRSIVLGLGLGLAAAPLARAQEGHRQTLWRRACLAAAPLARAQEVGGGADESNIGRTEADDGNEEILESTQLGQVGPIQIPFTMPQDGTATIGLYTKGGQLVRILGQVLSLTKGDYRVRWDGLDLFGNPVPPGTELDCKVILNKPIQAFYEFSVAAPKVAPWSGTFGTGANQRQGGWLADHSPPSCAVAVGDKILLGSTLAEHGHNLIAVDQSGAKIWGTQLAGWDGPTELQTDGQSVYALQRGRTTLWRVNPDLQPDGRGGLTLKKQRLLGSTQPIQSYAVSGDKLFLVKPNPLSIQDPFRMALSNGQIDFTKSRPQILNNVAPTEFMIGAQTAWGNTFTAAGNPQNGANMVLKNREAFGLVVFTQPIEVGTVVLGRIGGAAKAQVYILKPGLAYTEDKSPLASSGDQTLDALNLNEFDTNWQLLGETDQKNLVSILPAPQAGLTTAALYVKAYPAKGQGPNWTPRLEMARLMKERFERVPVPPSLRQRWSFRTETPVNSIYPATIDWTLPAPVSFDGMLLLNCVNPLVSIQTQQEGAWQPIGQYKAKQDKRLRFLSASKVANEQYVSFPTRVSTQNLRFQIESGYRAGKWGKGADDQYQVETDEIALVRLLEERPSPPTHIFEVASATDGKTIQSWKSSDYNIAALGAAPDGTLYGVARGQLHRLTVTDAGVQFSALGTNRFVRPIRLAVDAQRLAVGDADQHAVFLFNHQGQLQHTIGGQGPRRRGAWNPNTIQNPYGIALAQDGSVWVAEGSFAPKRVARFDAQAKFQEEFLGPPMYGGGGHLDPSLKYFYYRSMEFALDWAKGTSQLQNLHDRLQSEETPVQVNNSFSYTGIDRPYHHNGQRYIVGQNTICRVENGTWRPCVVMGQAANSHFLLGKQTWNRHWAKLDLTGKLFLWCDRNDDGRYQVEEVELFEAQELGGGFGSFDFGPGFTLWSGHLRAQPSGWTPSGAPLFQKSDFKPFKYDALAPHYPRNYTLGGPKSAKPHYNGFRYISSTGALAQEGQPYLVLPDGTIKGGPVTTKPSDYIPTIDGVVQLQPWVFTGGARTKSPVGEIAVVNSNLGYWYVWSVEYGCVIGRFFTGQTGGWGWGLSTARGHNVTGRKHEWEGWHGQFLRADNGQYYATAGKGFHGISRIEGLDDFQVQTVPVTVSAEQARLAAQLRPVLKGRLDAAGLAYGKSSRRELAAPALATRTKKFKLDGEIDDWGPRHKLIALGDPKQQLVFDISHDERGLYMAWGGQGSLAAQHANWKELFRNGFGFDLQWRGQSSGRDSDRRLVISKLAGKWTAVLYDYQAQAQPQEGLSYESANAISRIGRVSQLPESAWKLVMRENTLEIDALTLEDSLDGLGEAPTLPGPAKKDRAQNKPKLGPTWSAELFLPWETLGLVPGRAIRFDVGLQLPDTQRLYWSNRHPAPNGDPALESLLNPAAWGWLSFTP